MKTKVLILEDDQAINNLIAMQLRAEGMEVIQSFDGQEAIDCYDDSFTLAILDIMVPNKDGFQVLEYIRERSFIPVIFLTARNEDVTKIKALGLGADDYVTKPFSVMEVIYRCKAQIRRYTNYSVTNETSDLLVHGDIQIKKSSFEVKLNDNIIDLSVKEFELLTYFMEHPGQVFTKQQLYEKVWGDVCFGGTNTVMVHISKLRDRLNDKGNKQKYIKTIKGLGYRMELQ